MARTPDSVTRKQDLEKLASLIRNGVQRSGKTISQIAKDSGINQSHLSNVLARQKSLRPAKIRSLSEVLGLPESELLTAAGYVAPGYSSVLDTVLFSEKSTKPVTVITDPRFLDSAIFLWIFRSRILQNQGIEWKLLSENWDEVPSRFHKAQRTIGFWNRRTERTSHADIKGLEKYRPNYWADLCIYKGYGLLARKKDAGDLFPTNPSRSEVVTYLNALLTRTKPQIITIGGETFSRLADEFPNDEIDWKRFEIRPYPNIDKGLELFLDGAGDLFMGGAPQHFAAARSGKCISLLNAESTPHLYSINTLICTEDLLQNEKPLLSAITAVWFEVCDRLKRDHDFREHMLLEINQMLRDDFHVTDHSISSEFVSEVFRDKENLSEMFPSRPAEIVDTITKLLGQSPAPEDAVETLTKQVFGELRLVSSR